MTSGRIVPAENSPETATRFDELVAAFVRLRQPSQVAAFLRDLCHFIDAVICYVGFLFPLWDAKRQTLADKIMKTVVIPV